MLAGCHDFLHVPWSISEDGGMPSVKFFHKDVYLYMLCLWYDLLPTLRGREIGSWLLWFSTPCVEAHVCSSFISTKIFCLPLGLVYGHTGHVRFLTSVEMSGSVGPKVEAGREFTGEGSAADRPGGISIHDIHRRSSMAATTATMASRMLVISGGDGYEDFRNSAANEGAGRDDSTNHLLLWQVW